MEATAAIARPRATRSIASSTHFCARSTSIAGSKSCVRAVQRRGRPPESSSRRLLAATHGRRIRGDRRHGARDRVTLRGRVLTRGVPGGSNSGQHAGPLGPEPLPAAGRGDARGRLQPRAHDRGANTRSNERRCTSPARHSSGRAAGLTQPPARDRSAPRSHPRARCPKHRRGPGTTPGSSGSSPP